MSSNQGGCENWGQWREILICVCLGQQGTPAYPRASAGEMGCLSLAAGDPQYLCVCVYLCTYVYVCVHVLTWNGPGGMVLQQIHLYQVTRFGQLLTHWPCLKFAQNLHITNGKKETLPLPTPSCSSEAALAWIKSISTSHRLPRISPPGLGPIC